MKPLDVRALARSGASLEGREPLARLPRLAAGLYALPAAGGTAEAARGELAWSCRGGHDARGRPTLHLELRADLPLRCDRCGGRCDFALDVARDFYLVDTQEQLDAIAIDDAPEEPLLGSVHFDLAALIEDEAILQLPLSPRHADCRLPDAVAPEPAELAPERPNPFAQLEGLRAQLRQRGEGSARKSPRKGR